MKYLYLIVAVLMSSVAFGQQVSYFKRDNQKAPSRDSALYIRTITETSPGSKRYNYTETFTTGEVYRTGQTTKPDAIVPEGEGTVYYLSGKKLSSTIYNNTRPAKVTLYYPNGTIYLVKEYSYTVKDASKPNEYITDARIITCNDSTGKPLVVAGNGRFKLFTPPENPKFNNPNPTARHENETGSGYEEGNIRNGQHDGEWKGGRTNSLFAYTENYKDGEFTGGRSVDVNGKSYTYKVLEATAEFPGGLPGLGQYIGRSVRYPPADRLNNVQGKVYLTFVVDKDGSVTDVKIIRSPSQAMAAESIRVMNECPTWKPGTQHGIPVRQQYTIPIGFTLADK